MKLEMGGNDKLTESRTLYETKELYEYVIEIYEEQIHVWIKEKYNNLEERYEKIKHKLINQETFVIQEEREYIYPTLPPEEDRNKELFCEKIFISTYNRNFSEEVEAENNELTDKCFRERYKLPYKQFLSKKVEEIEGVEIITYEAIDFDVNQKIPIGTTQPNALTFADMIKGLPKQEEIETEYKIKKIRQETNQNGEKYCKIIEEKTEKLKFNGLGLTEVESKACSIEDVIISIK